MYRKSKSKGECQGIGIGDRFTIPSDPTWGTVMVLCCVKVEVRSAVAGDQADRLR